MRARRRVGVLLATALTALSLSATAQAATAQAVTAQADAEPASGCAEGGVSVLVDFGDLAADRGVDVRTGCDDEAEGERAAQSLADAGIELTYATRSPGFVCRVDGVPADDPCVNAAPADAYWSVWWAEAGGDWVYASQGVATLRTPVDGHLALVWHRGAEKVAPPSVDPGAVDPGAVDAVTGDAATPAAAEEADGLPGWVVPAALAALVAAGALVVVRRRQA